jgi:hypothetical protein
MGAERERAVAFEEIECALEELISHLIHLD